MLAVDIPATLVSDCLIRQVGSSIFFEWYYIFNGLNLLDKSRYLRICKLFCGRNFSSFKLWFAIAHEKRKYFSRDIFLFSFCYLFSVFFSFPFRFSSSHFLYTTFNIHKLNTQNNRNWKKTKIPNQLLPIPFFENRKREQAWSAYFRRRLTVPRDTYLPSVIWSASV